MWLDLFTWANQQTDLLTKELIGAVANIYPETTIDLPNPIPEETTIANDAGEGGVSVSLLVAEGDVGQLLDVHLYDTWQNFVYGFYFETASGFALMGKRLRVRAMFAGNSTGESGNIKGVGDFGFLFRQGSESEGEHTIRGTTKVSFGDPALWPNNNDPTDYFYSPVKSELSYWIEFPTITPAYLVQSGWEFVGMGYVGAQPDAGGPAWSELCSEWQIWVDDDQNPGGPKPWWLCKPKPPVVPCPVRPTTFVEFKDYDKDFTYPLASSRVPARVIQGEDCT